MVEAVEFLDEVRALGDDLELPYGSVVPDADGSRTMDSRPRPRAEAE